MKNLFILLITFYAINSYAQSTVGVVAHWDMNGTTNDVSGNGHNGNANYLTPATGISGLPNTAYYFNGSTSNITAPYSPAYNFTKYSFAPPFYPNIFTQGHAREILLFLVDVKHILVTGLCILMIIGSMIVRYSILPKNCFSPVQEPIHLLPPLSGYIAHR